jgi:hypothetical protein
LVKCRFWAGFDLGMQKLESAKYVGRSAQHGKGFDTITVYGRASESNVMISVGDFLSITWNGCNGFDCCANGISKRAH